MMATPNLNFLQVALSGTLYFVGLLIGALIAGYPADKIGRKPVLFFFIFTGGMSTLVGGLVSSFGAYSFFRLLAGIGEQGLTQITCTMSIEIVGAKYQSLVGNWNQIFFALGTGVVSSKNEIFQLFKTNFCDFFRRFNNGKFLSKTCWKSCKMKLFQNNFTLCVLAKCKMS